MNWVFRISVVLNTVLAAVAAWVFVKPHFAAPPPTPPLNSPAASTPPALEPPPLIAEQLSVITVTNAFHWDALESTNYTEFAANLRNVGCPERTVRDIIFADAERRHTELEYLESAPDEPIPFWLAGRELATFNQRVGANRTTGQAALAAELQHLFGVEWSPMENEFHRLEFQAMARMILGPVPEASNDAAWRWLANFIRAGETYRRQREGVILERDQIAWHAFVTERQAQLTRLLGPLAFEEFQARSALLEDVLGPKLIYLEDQELTPAELRQLCLVKIRECGWLEELFELRRGRDTEKIAAKRIAFTAALKSVLTPEHFEEFVRVQDDNYRQLLRATRDSNLPRRAAQQLFELRQHVLPEYQHLQAASANPEAAAALAELQAATINSARQILGNDAFNKFSIGPARWITNLSKL